MKGEPVRARRLTDHEGSLLQRVWSMKRERKCGDHTLATLKPTRPHRL